MVQFRASKGDETVALTIQGLKNIRQNEKRRLRNKSIKAGMRTQMKKVLVAVKDKNKEAAESALKVAYRELDRAATKGVVLKNGEPIGRIDLMFSHVDQSLAGAEFPEENFVFTGQFKRLIAPFVDRADG